MQKVALLVTLLAQTPQPVPAHDLLATTVLNHGCRRLGLVVLEPEHLAKVDVILEETIHPDC